VNKSRRIRRMGYKACMGEKRDVYWVFVEKPEEKRPLERPGSGWEDKWILRK
jgi:hypothetical protein